MENFKIKSSDIEALKISSLPTRPTAAAAFGGKGYNATEMKEAFDKLPLHIVEKFNAFIDLMSAEGENSIYAKINISPSYTVYDLFLDMFNGNLANMICVDADSVAVKILKIEERLAKLEGQK
jgi:hypothetical protein